MQNVVISKLVSMFVTKKRLIGWIAALGFGVGAAAIGMDSKEFKEAVCGAPVLEEVKK